MATTPGWALRLGRSRVGQRATELVRRAGLPRAVLLALLAAGAVVAAAGFGFTVALEDALEGDGVAGSDPVVQRFFVHHRSPALTDAFRAVTQLGGSLVIGALVLLVTALLLWNHQRTLAFGLVVATAGTELLVGVMKLLVDRGRPPPVDRLAAAASSAFPSGHSAQAVACYGALAWIVIRLVPTQRVRAIAVLGAVTIGVAIGLSRLYLGVHWASDVLSGWLLGAAWLAVTIAVCALIPTVQATRGRTRASRANQSPGHHHVGAEGLEPPAPSL